ncbi:MAG TPA: hypothetical protein VE645_11045 [Pseudonocardiaceae bacterium]|nr:hypothetical protein [Pseudonocardiaceae bacterium]
MLLGTSEYRSPDLPGIPAVQRNLASLRAVLTDGTNAAFSSSPDVCVVRRNPRSVDEFMQDLSNGCAAASDVLFVYYAGHGVLDSRMRLNLALRGTNPNRPEGNAVPLQMVKEQVEMARARVRVLVLDCCFSGQALGWQSATASSTRPQRPPERSSIPTSGECTCSPPPRPPRWAATSSANRTPRSPTLCSPPSAPATTAQGARSGSASCMRRPGRRFSADSCRCPMPTG